MTRRRRAGAPAACPLSGGTGDVTRPGSSLTYRACPDCGGTGVSDEQPPGYRWWVEPGDGTWVVVEHGPDPTGRPLYEVWHRDDALAARARAGGWFGYPDERWFDPAEPDDTAPSAWLDLLDSSLGVVAIRPLGEPLPAPVPDVLPVPRPEKACRGLRSVAAEAAP